MFFLLVQISKYGKLVNMSNFHQKKIIFFLALVKLRKISNLKATLKYSQLEVQVSVILYFRFLVKALFEKKVWAEGYKYDETGKLTCDNYSL